MSVRIPVSSSITGEKAPCRHRCLPSYPLRHCLVTCIYQVEMGLSCNTEKIPSLSVWGLIGLLLNSFNSWMCLRSLVLEGLEQRDSSRPCLSLYADKDHSVSHWTILCYHPVVAFDSQNSLTFFFWQPGLFCFCLIFRFYLGAVISHSLVIKSNIHMELAMRMVIVSSLIAPVPSPKSCVDG